MCGGGGVCGEGGGVTVKNFPFHPPTKKRRKAGEGVEGKKGGLGGWGGGPFAGALSSKGNHCRRIAKKRSAEGWEV